MGKSAKSPQGNLVAKAMPVGVTVVRNAKTGRPVTVKGVGALKGDGLKIKKGVSLLKPIAKQTLAARAEKRKAG